VAIPVSRRSALAVGAGTIAGLPLGQANPRVLDGVGHISRPEAAAFTAGTVDAFASWYPANPRVVTHVTSMQAGHGWTAANTSATNLNDTTAYALGSQSASITTRTDGVASTLAIRRAATTQRCNGRCRATASPTPEP
jgi:hypothetical protein